MCTRRGRPDVFRTVGHGFRHGIRPPLLLAVDCGRYLDRPLDEVRQSLDLEVAAPHRVFYVSDAHGAPDGPPEGDQPSARARARAGSAR